MITTRLGWATAAAAPRDHAPRHDYAGRGKTKDRGSTPAASRSLRCAPGSARHWPATRPTDGPRRDFLVTATPGAGKTTFALTLAARLLERRAIDRVVVVAPTDHLRTQWADAADRLGIGLDAALSNATGPVRPDLTGYVTTYAQVAAKPALHHARTVHKRTLVVLDEVHHAGDGLSWGDAVAAAFESAARRLCLTGTPFRTRPDERIPFVRYESDTDGGFRSSADFTLRLPRSARRRRRPPRRVRGVHGHRRGGGTAPGRSSPPRSPTPARSAPKRRRGAPR